MARDLDLRRAALMILQSALEDNQQPLSAKASPPSADAPPSLYPRKRCLLAGRSRSGEGEALVI